MCECVAGGGKGGNVYYFDVEMRRGILPCVLKGSRHTNIMLWCTTEGRQVCHCYLLSFNKDR